MAGHCNVKQQTRTWTKLQESQICMSIALDCDAGAGVESRIIIMD